MPKQRLHRRALLGASGLAVRGDVQPAQALEPVSKTGLEGRQRNVDALSALSVSHACVVNQRNALLLKHTQCGYVPA